MGIVRKEGSLKKTPIDNHDIAYHETPLVIPNNYLVSNDNNHAELANVRDTFTTRTAVQPNKFNDQYPMLLAYNEGTSIKVTYFHRNISDQYAQMIDGEMDPSEDAIHTDLTQINNFEMRMISPLEAEFNDDNSEAIGSFSVVVYPGFTPYEGDIFFFDIGDGHIGECRVDKSEKTSIRQNAYHRLLVQVIGTLNKDKLKFYQDRVIDTYYFDKHHYFNNNFTFLKQETYVTLETLEHKKIEIIQYYFDKFFNKDANSILRLDGIYDPYLVEFLIKKISFSYTNVRPTQLLTYLPDYNKSLWYFLMDSSYIDMKQLLPTGYILTHTVSVYDPRKNWMVNKSYLSLTKQDTTIIAGRKIDLKGSPYVFSPEFYNEITMHMTNIEKLVYNAKVLKIIDSSAIAKQISNYRSLDDNLAFYHLPIYLYLTDMALTYLQNP